MKNATPGFKFELKVTLCPPDSQKNDPAAAGRPQWKMPRNPSQTIRKLIAS